MPNVEWTNKNTLQNLIDTIHARLIQKVPHYTTMPTASADLLGEVVQFVGETGGDYINAYFYKCNEVEDESTGAISYEWQAVEVQDESDDYVGDKATFEAMTPNEKNRYKSLFFTDV